MRGTSPCLGAGHDLSCGGSPREGQAAFDRAFLVNCGIGFGIGIQTVEQAVQLLD